MRSRWTVVPVSQNGDQILIRMMCNIARRPFAQIHACNVATAQEEEAELSVSARDVCRSVCVFIR